MQAHGGYIYVKELFSRSAWRTITKVIWQRGRCEPSFHVNCPIASRGNFKRRYHLWHFKHNLQAFNEWNLFTIETKQLEISLKCQLNYLSKKPLSLNWRHQYSIFIGKTNFEFVHFDHLLLLTFFAMSKSPLNIVCLTKTLYL